MVWVNTPLAPKATGLTTVNHMAHGTLHYVSEDPINIATAVRPLLTRCDVIEGHRKRETLLVMGKLSQNGAQGEHPLVSL